MPATLILPLALVLICGASSAMAQSRQDCEDRWLEAEAAGITRGHAIVGGVPTVVVDARTWASIPYDTKLGMVETFNCAVAGPGRMLIRIDFVSHLTNNVVGRWEVGKGLVVMDRR